MINRALFLVLCLVLVTAPITMIAAASPTVGVNAGEWIKWNIAVIVPSQNQSLTGWLQVTIQGVTGTQVNGTYVGSSDNTLGLPVSSADFTVDVATGVGTNIFKNLPIIVPQNLSTGDSVPGTSLVVSTSLPQNDRDAAFTSTFANNATSLYYWDRLKGVLLDYYYANSTDKSSTTMEIADTNMWGAGVSAGDWIRWDITVTTPSLSTTMWLQVTIQNVSITQVKATYESNIPGEPSDPTDFTINVATGAQNTSIYSGIDGLMVVSAKLSPGDLLPKTLLRVNGTATKDGRDAVFASLLSNVSSSTYYWDSVKGVLLEFSGSIGNTTTLIKVADTNIWGGGGINWSLWIEVAIVVVVIVLAVYVVFRRRRSAKA